jgi:2TM domain-containing protein
MANERRYSDREVRTILERAAKHEPSDGLSHEDLLAAAREAGISTDAVEQAAQELDRLQAWDEARERIIARRRSGFFSHLWAFLGVQLFLLALNLLTTPGYLWFFFPLLGWGLGLFFAARHGLSEAVSERAISREMARAARFAPIPSRRPARALAAPSAKLRARAPARVSETLPHEEPGPAQEEARAPGDASPPEAQRERR